MDSNFVLNEKCYIQDSAGFIRFIGNTEFAEGLWIGVELDDPNGKNDGSVQGVVYFICKQNYGIFCRPTQLSKHKKSKLSSSRPQSRIDRPITTRPSTAMDKPMNKASKSAVDLKTQRRSLQDSRPSSRLSTPIMDSMDVDAPKSKNRLSYQESVKDIKQPGPFVPVNVKNDISEELDQLKSLLNEKESIITDLNGKMTKLNDLEGLFQQSKADSMQYLEKNKLLEHQLEIQLDHINQLKTQLDKQPSPKITNEVEELLDQIELLTLDKEYAQEQADFFKLQSDEYKLQLDTISSTSNDLVQLKLYTQSLTTEINALKQKISNSQELESRNNILEQQNSELLEQLNSLESHDLLVQELTEKNLKLSFDHSQLKSELSELEALKEMSDEIEHRYADALQELQQQLSQQNSKQIQLETTIQQQQQVLMEYEKAIKQLKESIHQYQVELQSLKHLNVDKDEELKWISQQSDQMLKLNVQLQKTAISIKTKQINEQIQLHYYELLQEKSSILNTYTICTEQDKQSINTLFAIKQIIVSIQVFYEQLQSDYVDFDSFSTEEIKLFTQFSFHLFFMKYSLETLVEYIKCCAAEQFLVISQLDADINKLNQFLNHLLESLKNDSLSLDSEAKSIESTSMHIKQVVESKIRNSPDTVTHFYSICIVKSMGHLADVLNARLDHESHSMVPESEALVNLHQLEAKVGELRLNIKRHLDIKEVVKSEVTNLVHSLYNKMYSIVNNPTEEGLNALLNDFIKYHQFFLDSSNIYQPILIQLPWESRATILKDQYITKQDSEMQLKSIQKRIDQLQRQLLIKEEELQLVQHKAEIHTKKQTSVDEEDVLKLKKQIQGFEAQESIYEDAIDELHMEIGKLQQEIIHSQQRKPSTSQIETQSYSSALIQSYKQRHDKNMKDQIESIITYIDSALPLSLIEKLKFKEKCRVDPQLSADPIYDGLDIKNKRHGKDLLTFYANSKVCRSKEEYLKQETMHLMLLSALK